jgi:hypothetical protein
MLERGETPPNVRSDINDQPPNPSQPPPSTRLQPRAKPWERNQAAPSSPALNGEFLKASRRGRGGVVCSVGSLMLRCGGGVRQTVGQLRPSLYYLQEMCNLWRWGSKSVSLFLPATLQHQAKQVDAEPPLFLRDNLKLQSRDCISMARVSTCNRFPPCADVWRPPPVPKPSLKTPGSSASLAAGDGDE